MNTFQDNILNKIKSGEIDMKPRWHFILRSLLLVLGVLLAALIGVYLLSFVFFALRQSGVGFIPLYGFRGLSQFVISSPWLLIATVVAFMTLLQILVSRYSFSYRRPLLYSMIGVVLFVLLVSLSLQKTQVHEQIRQYTESHNIPVFTPMYRGIEENQPKNIVNGVITELNPDGFILLSNKQEVLQVIINSETRQRPGTTYTLENKVSVFGDRAGDTITAIGIRPLEKNRANPDRDEIKPRRNNQTANPYHGRPGVRE